MDAYTEFAQVYDLFMQDVPYDAWCENLLRILETYEIRDGLVLDLGCGTGQMTRRMEKQGYDMIGVDASWEMLQEAVDAGRGSVLYLNQDMREFELYGTVRAIYSVCDSMNYLLEEGDLLEVFRLAENYLDPGGVLIFDLNTRHKYRDCIGTQTIYEARDEACFVWENEYDEVSGINRYDVTFFIEEESGLYRRVEETHFQRGYEIETVKELLLRAGLSPEGVYDADRMTENGGFSPAEENSERVYFVARCIAPKQKQAERRQT